MGWSDQEPGSVWKHFTDICGIPHPSRHEETLALALVEWARGRGFAASRGAGGNVVIRKPARPGRESSRGVILQGHLDMVPQAAPGSSHDFLRDPIRPRQDPGDPRWLVADGTTLGADNGIGLAMALAVLEEPDLSHGPLECLFTTNEEDGMTGAREVAPGILEGKILLNLDGEDDRELTVGCAGSIRTAAELSLPAEKAPAGLSWFEASVGGLAGGHSGIDIDKGRANAPLVLTRLLRRSEGSARIAALGGGTAANAIPRAARACIGVGPEEVEGFRSAFLRETAALRAELGPADPGLTAELKPLTGEAPSLALPAEESDRLLALLSGLPNGLRALEPDMPGSIRTSSNLGRLDGRIEGGRFRVSTLVMVRSSSESDKADLAGEIETVLGGAVRFGWLAEISRPSDSPAWAPNPASPLLAAARSAYRDLFGEDPRIVSTHGGLETGIFRPVFPDWDMLSFGPKILNPHSPDERLEIASVGRSYRFLKELLVRAG